ncbi:trypsin-like peptidase domain-containing protein [Microvirga sp. W0021]|uniref:Probable periplasmic serine endoprotease DegP-like n=1 Tax=Hohaiivirga grylli TaxID=3133970 RepID=A0ABV0BHH8_9HYPH
MLNQNKIEKGNLPIANSVRSRPVKSKKLVCAALAAVLMTGGALSSLAFVASEPAHAELRSSDQPIQAAPSFADVIERVKPAVVSVRVKVQNASFSGSGDNSDLSQMPPEMRRFFQQFSDQNQFSGRRSAPVSQAQGSGFFISADGYLVTNNHVVDNAVDVQVLMDDGKTLEAKVVGTDPKSDLALLKVDGQSDLPYVRLAKTKPRVGEWVLAVGNPFGLGGTVTSGIVSAEHRDIGEGPYDDFLQIDASVNRGNSGGPTFNLSGEVVGVNTAIYSPSGGSVGIAFAIPASTVEKITNDLKDKGTVSRGYIGIAIQPVSPEIAEAIGLKDGKGALVARSVLNGPAAKAGIKTGDTIIAVNGEAINEPKDLSRKIASVSPGQSVTVKVFRAGQEREVKLTVESQPKGA